MGGKPAADVSTVFCTVLTRPSRFLEAARAQAQSTGVERGTLHSSSDTGKERSLTSATALSLTSRFSPQSVAVVLVIEDSSRCSRASCARRNEACRRRCIRSGTVGGASRAGCRCRNSLYGGGGGAGRYSSIHQRSSTPGFCVKDCVKEIFVETQSVRAQPSTFFFPIGS